MRRIEDIRIEIEKYQAELETMIQGDDINFLIERGSLIASYYARIGFLYAEAQKLARGKKGEEIANMVRTIAKEGHLSSKAQNALVDSIATEEMFVVDWLDRLNSMCVHQLDYIRTLISKIKAEMQMNNFIAKNE